MLLAAGKSALPGVSKNEIIAPLSGSSNQNGNQQASHNLFIQLLGTLIVASAPFLSYGRHNLR
jgi:hypothetical protein